MPNFPCEFEVRDDWIAESGIVSFRPMGTSYRSAPSATLIPLISIEPPYRRVTHPKDWRGFDHDRLTRILRGFVDEAEIDPVPLFKLPVTDFPHTPYQYRVLNGFHRFYASIAAGFEDLPAVIS